MIYNKLKYMIDTELERKRYIELCVIIFHVINIDPTYVQRRKTCVYSFLKYDYVPVGKFNY